jgi:hypothetical protein
MTVCLAWLIWLKQKPLSWVWIAVCDFANEEYNAKRTTSSFCSFSQVLLAPLYHRPVVTLLLLWRPSGLFMSGKDGIL